jgi:hypothetical protein
MTGGEIAAAGKAVEAVGKKVLAEDEKTKDVLLRTAEDTPEMKAAARSMAARVAVKERVKLKLYQPFARMLGVSKAYFEDTFPLDMAAKIADIPEEHLITPPASVAVPALLGLSYTFEEPSLKDLYLNLLTTASDDRSAGQAHPAFADIIKQLSSSEAQLLNQMLPFAVTNVPVARVMERIADPSGAVQVRISHLLPIFDSQGDPEEYPQVSTWVDNWQRLGLVSATYRDFVVGGDNAYDWVEARPEYIRLVEDPHVAELTFDKGVLKATDFGWQFFHAVN